MALKIARICIVALALMLAGCFRPAGEAIEPTPTLDEVAIPTREDIATGDFEVTEDTDFSRDLGSGTEELDTGEDETQEALPAGLPEGNFPPITVIQSTRPPAPTEPATLDPNSTALPGSTPTFITPGVPLGPIATDAPPTEPGGALTATPSGLITPTDFFAASDNSCIYVVQPGDNLFRIATQHGVTVDDMRAVNPDLVGEAPILQPGQQLNLPNCGQAATDSPGDVAAPEQPAVEAPPGGEIYTVQAGDTLMRIAQRFNTTIDAIVAANNLSNPNRLDIGQQLVIPPPGG
ncbi:MAG: LysM peptidoglycan-binding domain-containing protein [Chloroflexota bacterium]|nr:MAG: hypothetical protein DIU68_18655 [Chloroflexota bacterium]